MARVIVILFLMVAITAGMFWITRKPAANAGVASTDTAAATTAPGATATVPLAELNAPPHKTGDEDMQDKPGEEQSTTSVDPRPVTNVPDALTVAAQATKDGVAAAAKELGTDSSPAVAATAPGTEPALAPAPTAAQDVTSGPVAGAAPSIGTAGIDRRNHASFTGTATPGEPVSIVWDNKTIGSTTADASGNWALEFKAPDTDKEHELMVISRGKDGKVVTGPQRAFIGPPSVADGLPQITLKAVDQLQAVATADAAPSLEGKSEPKVGLVLDPVTADAAGAAKLSGKADPGATVKVAINGKAVGETVVGADGAWSLSVANATRKAGAKLRLELVDSKGAKIDRTELPLKIAAADAAPAVTEPKTAVAETSPATAPAEPAKDEAAKAVDKSAAVPAVESARVHDKPERRVIRVRRGDSLWSIARRHLGNGKKWARFYRLNKHKIDNPDLIYPGQTLILPG